MSGAESVRVGGIRLWVKLAAFAAVAVVVTHAIHLAVGSRVATRAIAREQEALGRGIARLVATHAADAVLTGDAVTLTELVVRAARSPEVAYCFVVRDGRAIATSFEAGTPAGLVALRANANAVAPAGPITVVDGDRRILDLEEPILDGGAGSVRLGIDMAVLGSVRRDIAIPLGVVALGAILLSLAIALVAGRRIAGPIDEIIAAADRFDPGVVPGEPIAPRGGREIASLAQRFNRMTARLRAAQEEQERMRQRALANERLATLGALVAGVAHEINNPLTSLKSAVALVRDNTTDARQRAEDLDIIDGALDQIADVVRRLLDFGRSRPLALEPVQVAALARESAGLAALSLKQRGIVIEQLAEADLDDAPVLADRKQVGQALLNLVLNAAFVSRDFGRVRLRLRRRGAFRGIAVEDDGPGIPPEIRDRIFDPFFSTKPAGQGTGLGLPLARAIADRHHGSLEFEFPERGGTVATLWLPTAAAASAAA